MNSVFTKDYQNKKIVPILKEYSAKKYGRRREFVDAETRARLGLGIDEGNLPEAPEHSEPVATEAVSEQTTEAVTEISSEQEQNTEASVSETTSTDT